jgi:putative copper export protein
MEIRLTFSLQVNPALSQIELFGPISNIPLAEITAHPDSSSVLIAAVPRSLEEGDYTVRWRIVGDDGHPVAGEYGFQIITPPQEDLPPGGSGASEPTPSEGDLRSSDSSSDLAQPEGDVGKNLPVGSLTYILVRWVNFAGILGVLGAVAFGLLVLPLAGLRVGRRVGSLTKSIPGKVGVISSAIVLLAAGARLISQRAAVFGTGAAMNLGQDNGALISTPWGAGWVIQILAGAAALVGFRMVGSRPRTGWGLALLGALSLSLTPALSGHAMSAEGTGLLPVLADTLHVIGAGGWIGSLFVLLLSAALSTSDEDSEGVRLFDLVGAFSPIALFFAAVLLVTGLFGAWTHLEGFSTLWTTGYGRVFLIKMAFLAPVLAIGAYNALRVRPALGAGEGGTRFRWSAGIELGVATLVLLVTSILVATPEPLHGNTSGEEEVTQVVEAFHHALASGDSLRVSQILAEDARILEGGGVETRQEYMSHHLLADMAFASSVQRVRGPVEVVVEGDVAWALSSDETNGRYQEREIDASGAELVVLTQIGGEWRIRAVHWSSGK